MPANVTRAAHQKVIGRQHGGYRSVLPTGIRIREGCETIAYAIATHVSEYVCPTVDICAGSWEAGCELEIAGPITRDAETSLEMTHLLDYAFGVSSGALEAGAKDGAPLKALALLDECVLSVSQSVDTIQVPYFSEMVSEAMYSGFVDECFEGMRLVREGFNVAPTSSGFRAMGLVGLAGRPRLLDVSCSTVFGVQVNVRLGIPIATMARAVNSALRAAAIARRNTDWSLLRVNLLDAEARLSMAYPVPIEPGCISGFLERSDAFLAQQESVVCHLLGIDT